MTAEPALVIYATEGEYRTHFERVYCQESIRTHDGILVRFRKNQFDHCMFESSRRDSTKDQFSSARAERIDWIKATLQNPAARLYQGWDSKRKRHDATHRVAVVYQDFVVIIRLRDRTSQPLSAQFVTAYKADNSLRKIENSPRWR